MLTYFQSFVLGALQGLTELFPISSLGHTVILPGLLGWTVDQHAELFVIFLVATHLATALVLLVFFWRDWLRIASGFFRSLAARRIPAGDSYARLSWLIIVATIPAGLLGLLFQHKLENFFAAPAMVALFLIGNGILLYGAELLRRRAASRPTERQIDATLAHLPFRKALGIGCMQALALFPGFSRTGATLAGGLLAGLTHETSARFSFLLATPIIFAAAALKLPKLAHVGHGVL
ncbi:MAG: undecaprenyl-diphosphate phosphatase, partial [Bacillota bacterium]